MQLNVSYNFKKLALKNDFNIRQFLIENGMNLTKDMDDMSNIQIDENTTTTALEIHQIVRTNRSYRAAPPDPISHNSETAPVRRNSTISSASATSTFQNTRDNNNSTPMMREDVARFVLPKPIFRPIQIKIEPIDEDSPEKNTTPEISNTSPSASSGFASSDVVTVNSSIPSNSPPMVVINRGNMNKAQLNSTWRSLKSDKHEVINSLKDSKSSSEYAEKKEKSSNRNMLHKIEESNIYRTTRGAQKKNSVTHLKSTRLSTKNSLNPTQKVEEKVSHLKLKKTDNNSLKAPKSRGRPRKTSNMKTPLKSPSNNSRGRPRKHPLPDRS